MHGIPLLHTPPAQQIAPDAPHAVHRFVALLHTSPALHHRPPPVPGQHGSPSPPQPVHTLAAHAENGAVQPTPPGQHACPMPPHVPLPHEPLVHVPCPPPHALPDETQVLDVWSQHAPAPHQSPSQHVCPAPPHAVHLSPAPHASPEVVQKLEAWPAPPDVPLQHVWPSLPHVPQDPFRHMPSPAEPQLCPIETHAPSTQQRLFPHVAFWQQG